MLSSPAPGPDGPKEVLGSEALRFKRMYKVLKL